MKNENIAVVVLSGGQDSVTCLGVALQECEKVYAISFQYGQKHNVELECAKAVCEKHNVSLKVVGLDFLGSLVTSALTGEGDVNAQHSYKKDLPASFVPNRNALFLTAAHAYAQEVDANRIYTGVCQTDYSGYPDCRAHFIELLDAALNEGYQTQIRIITPLMYLSKAETFMLADYVGILDDVLELSHTCYNGDRSTRHEWGYGCGKCPACELRKTGWEEYKKLKASK